MKLYIYIYDQFIEFEYEEMKIENTIRYQGTYNHSDDSIDIVEHFMNFILRIKGDGVDIELTEYKEFATMRIFLIYGLQEIEFIIDEFKRVYNSIKEDISDNSLQLGNYQNFLYLEAIESELNLEEIKDLLAKIVGEYDSLDYVVLNTKKRRTQHGAGGGYLSLLIATIGIVAPIVTPLIKSKIEEKRKYDLYVQYGEFDINRLYLNLARELQNSDVRKYKVDSFKDNGEGIYTIILGTKDVKHEIVANNKSNILKKQTTYYI